MSATAPPRDGGDGCRDAKTIPRLPGGDWDYELPSFFGIWSTLDDVARWDTALRRHTLLTPESLEA